MSTKKMTKRVVNFVLTVLMVVGTMPALETEVFATDGVQYLYRSWDSANKKVVTETKTANCVDYKSSMTDLDPGWYYVNGEHEVKDRVNVSGEVNIIILDGSTLYLKDGIHVPAGSTLNIYNTPGGENGLFNAVVDTNNYAAIGGNDGEAAGNINIHSGKVIANAYNDNKGDDAAGIGGGCNGNGGTVRIYGGTVMAQGAANEFSSGAAGIGGGYKGTGGETFIYGGTVTATGGPDGAGIGGGNGASGGGVYIHGGNVIANGGDYAAGIGSGDADGENIHGGNVGIYGGDVTAAGGCDAAGIGGGEEAAGGNIHITAGTVKATGGVNGAGIGGGDCGEGGTITISGGNKITATGGANGAGIGGGNDQVFTKIEISGGTIEATGGGYAAGIGSGDTDISTDGGAINISGGNITAIGGTDAAGIGGGETCSGGNITITDGEINATGGLYGAGIGSGDGGSKGSGKITIKGGKITATGGEEAAGIGGGNQSGVDNQGTIDISGGTIIANGGKLGAGIGGGDGQKGGTINISGGDIRARAGIRAAGIGGGDGQDGGNITISGGKVSASGGSHGGDIGDGYRHYEGGAGIGGGDRADCGEVIISGGEVNASGTSNGAGIGGGGGGSGSNITITGGEKIEARGGYNAAGIGGGTEGKAGKIKITDGNVYAEGGAEGAGIGSGYVCSSSAADITIDGGNITAVGGNTTAAGEACKGAAIGAGGCFMDQKDPDSLNSKRAAFTGKICFNGGTVTVQQFWDTPIGTTTDWGIEDGEVYFNGSTVIAYHPDCPATRMVRTAAGKIHLKEDNTIHQSVRCYSSKADFESKNAVKIAYADDRLKMIEDGEGFKYKVVQPCDHVQSSYEDKGESHDRTCESCAIEAFAENHSYGDPVWRWTKDYTATASFTCSKCKHVKTMDATVTSEDHPDGDHGYTLYTATVQLGEKTYTDTRKKNIGDDVEVITEPTANKLTYIGSEQELVTGGEVRYGEMRYALGTNAQDEPEDGWSTAIPTGKNAGTYYVWYMVKGDDKHNDVEPQCIAVEIAKVPFNELQFSLDPNTAVYTGQEIKPKVICIWKGHKFELLNNEECVISYIRNINAGQADVGILCLGIQNIGYGYKSLDFRITKAENKASVTMEDWTVKEVAKTPQLTADFGADTAAFAYKKKDADSTYTDAVPSEEGEYTVKATIPGTGNYAGAEATCDFEITHEHEWGELSYEWAEDNSTVTATRSCKRQGCTHEETETVSAASEVTKAATCTAKGSKTLTATFKNTAFAAQTKTVEIAALGHDYGSWTKKDDTSHQRVCSHDKTHVETEAHTWDSGKVTKEATETAEGVKTYACTVCGATKTETIPVKDHTHDWEGATYTWSSDNKTVTATRVCTKDSTHKETETVNATEEVTKAATCTAKGSKTLTATFKNTAFAAQTKTVEIAALGHDYGSWTKKDDTSHQRVCSHDKTHVETEAHTWDSGKVTKEATETAEGVKTYACTVCGATKTETIPVKDHTHDWEGATYTWSSDNKTVTATRVCTKDSTHKETETVNATSAVTKPATIGAKGETTYTASFTKEYFEEQSKTVADIDKVDPQPLADAIAAAQASEEGVETSDDGSDTAKDKQWTTAGEKQALEDAVATAQEVLRKEAATQNDVDAATQAVESAIQAYNSAKKNGTKSDPTPTPEPTPTPKPAPAPAPAATAAPVTTVTVNTKTAGAAVIQQAIQAAGGNVDTLVLGKSVKKIGKKAFAGTGIKTIVVESKKLKKKSVKGSLKGSSVTTVKVKVGKAKTNKKYVKKYKKIFTKKNAGKKVKVKR